MHPRKFVRDSIGLALSQYLARAVLIGRGLVAAGALGPGGYGAWNALNLVLDYGSYASLGAIQGLDLKLPSAAAHHDHALARWRLQGAWTVILMGCALFAIALAIYLMTGWRLIETPWGWFAPALMLVAAMVQLAIQYHSSALRAYGAFQTVSVALGIQAVIGGGLGLLLVLRFGVWGLLWSWLAGGVVALAWMRRIDEAPPLRPAALREGLALARTGFPVFAFFTTSLVLRSLDRMALIRFGGSDSLGHYSIGLMAAGIVLYLPESAAAVLYPRITAASHGARDPERARAEVAQTHRALAIMLPLAIGCMVLWAAPVVGWLLPAYREGVPSLRLLVLGALMLSAATVPAYYLLGRGRIAALLTVGAASASITALLVFGTAARDPRPVAIALAASLGYATFAAGLIGLAAFELHRDGVSRVRFVLASFVPALWAGAIALVLSTRPAAGSVAGAALFTLVFGIAYLPVFWWFGRGIGLRQLAHEWLAARPAAA